MCEFQQTANAMSKHFTTGVIQLAPARRRSAPRSANQAPARSILDAARPGVAWSFVFQRTARALPILLLLLAGCTAVPRPDSGSGEFEGIDVPGSSADAEVARYRNAISRAQQLATGARTDRAPPDHRQSPRVLAGPWINLALIDIRKNDIDGARKNLANALERNPKMPQAFNLRGFVELSQGNVNKAAEDYRQAIALRDSYAIAHYNYALIHDIYYQDMKVAVRHYKRYLELTGNQGTPRPPSGSPNSSASWREKPVMKAIFSLTTSFCAFFASAAMAQDRAGFESIIAIIKGNKEFPRITQHVVPWKDTDLTGHREQTLVLHSLFGDLFDPVYEEAIDNSAGIGTARRESSRRISCPCAP
ncbi:MAG: tetratricopeptide repeat protein [Chromatiales bacterium]|nr:tetratricopeptide repeat protein [Chromatiales bacterium]